MQLSAGLHKISHNIEAIAPNGLMFHADLDI